MIKNNLPAIEQNLQQIVDMLILNGTIMDCPGLVHGKMGIAIFFFHYARYTDNALFVDYAFDLIGEIMSQIHVNSPADYEKGIAGIGVGIDYLLRNNFFNVEENIFEDFDQKMYRAVMCDPWQDFSLYDGLTGYGRYWLSRLSQENTSAQTRECLLRITGHIKEKLPDIPASEQSDVYCFLHNLQKKADFNFCADLSEQCNRWNLEFTNFHRFDNSFVGNIVRIYQCSHYFNNPQCEFENALKQVPNLNMEKPPFSLGLLTGYAGEGMLRLTVLNHINPSWMHLL